MKITADTPGNRASVSSFKKAKVADIIKLGRKLEADAKRAQRRSLQLCKLCYYSPAIGGRAITAYECLRCETISDYGTNNVPILCPTCAKATEQCVQCGADLEYRETISDATTSVPKQPKTDDL